MNLDPIILMLAVWRISSMFVAEDGPWDILAKFRHAVGVRYNEYSVPYGTGMMGNLFSCVWCLSVWVGAIVGLLYLFWPTTIVHLALLPALSAGAIIVESIVRR